MSEPSGQTTLAERIDIIYSGLNPSESLRAEMKATLDEVRALEAEAADSGLAGKMEKVEQSAPIFDSVLLETLEKGTCANCGEPILKGRFSIKTVHTRRITGADYREERWVHASDGFQHCRTKKALAPTDAEQDREGGK